MSAGNVAIDSNVTGLHIAEEVLGQPKVLPGTPVWYPIEPNSYSDFGAQTKTVKRETINASRQKRKGAVVGLEVPAGFSLDFTSKVPYFLMKGFMFADWREKANLTVTAVTGTAYTVASGGAAFLTGDLVFAENFGVTANNGLKVLAANATATSVTTPGVAAEASPPATATITRVGREGASADYTITIVDGRPQLNTVAGNFSTLGLIPGEWIWVGGDATANQFAEPEANGWYRVYSVANLAISFDRWPGDTSNNPVAAAGTGKTIRIFTGHAIKNEADTALQKFRTYQIERSLGGNRFQYELGCGANSLKLMVKTQDKVTMDLGYVALNEDLATTVAKAGTRKTLPNEVVYNAETSFSRIRMIGGDGKTPVTGIMTDLSLSIDNGIEPLTGITNNLGGVDLKCGDFSVSGTVEAYLSTLEAVAAVKANPDCSIDFGMVENVGTNAIGWLFDIPLLMLGDGRVKVEKDKPITLPVSIDAAGHSRLNHTLLVMHYPFLPQLAL